MIKRLLFLLLLTIFLFDNGRADLVKIYEAADTLTGTGSDSTLIDTVTHNVDLRFLDFGTDTVTYLFIFMKLDTINNDTSNAWKDSGHVPCVKIEYLYLMDLQGKLITADTLENIGWTSVSDSILHCGSWYFRSFKITRLTSKIKLRIRDASSLKKGYRHGKWVYTYIFARREN